MPFLRLAEVIVGTANKAISIKDLRITFEVQKSLISYPNRAVIRIYNLNETTRNQIKNEFTNVLINAGYENSVSLIFTGNIKNVYHHIDDVDTITEIYAGDGDEAWISSVVNFSSSASQSLIDTVSSIVETMPNITLGNLLGLDQGKVSSKTITFSGSSREALNQLADTYNFDWSIQNNIFETTVRGDAAQPQTTATLISAETGMVGSPTVTELGADVTVFLNPALLPNRWILIRASGSDISLGDPYFRIANKPTVAQGYYIINELLHVFDNRGDDALTKIKGRQVQ